jgi:hypothetical protein
MPSEDADKAAEESSLEKVTAGALYTSVTENINYPRPLMKSFDHHFPLWIASIEDQVPVNYGPSTAELEKETLPISQPPSDYSCKTWTAEIKRTAILLESGVVAPAICSPKLATTRVKLSQACTVEQYFLSTTSRVKISP